jgi:hypothetical protein
VAARKIKLAHPRDAAHDARADAPFYPSTSTIAAIQYTPDGADIVYAVAAVTAGH